MIFSAPSLLDRSVLSDESDESSELLELSGNLGMVLDFFLICEPWSESEEEVIEGAERLGMMEVWKKEINKVATRFIHAMSANHVPLDF